MEKQLDERAAAFLSVKKARELSDFFGVDYSNLTYLLVGLDERRQYYEFEIQKKNGGKRIISAPNNFLKRIQSDLNKVLCQIYDPKYCVHGYVFQKGIVTNALQHRNQRFVLNIDLKDFFPSINFGRVFGLFKSDPFNFDHDVAVLLAKACTHKNQLPQGAPTSAVVSNIICSRMDRQLLRLAEANKCYYTRYADDLTFSTSLKSFPNRLFEQSRAKGVSEELEGIITTNGFSVNYTKVRLQTKLQRQAVTGLVVNKKLNVKREYLRELRGLLHACEEYAVEKAMTFFFEKYYRKSKNPNLKQPDFLRIVKGRVGFVGMVRGKEDELYRKFKRRFRKVFKEADSAAPLDLEPIEIKEGTLILTEGKSDWKHLKAAWRYFKTKKYFENVSLNIYGKENMEMGHNKLLSTCKYLADIPRKEKVICIFDSDDKAILKDVNEGGGFKHWGNNVYSFSIPIPKARNKSPLISIEFYYDDADITRVDKEGRRLFINDEFNRETGFHVKVEGVNCQDKNKLKTRHRIIVDDKVYNTKNENVALSKNNFGSNILNGVEGFNDVDFSNFYQLFEVVDEIIKE